MQAANRVAMIAVFRIALFIAFNYMPILNGWRSVFCGILKCDQEMGRISLAGQVGKDRACLHQLVYICTEIRNLNRPF